MNLIQSLFDQIETHLPTIALSLNSGLASNTISDFEKKYDIRLHEEFKHFYTEHNGQDLLNSIGLFLGYRAITLERIELEIDSLSIVLESCGDDYEDGEFTSIPTYTTIHKVYSKKWIPFAEDCCGNYIALDYDPGKNGRIGQVIMFGRNIYKTPVLAWSYGEFITWYLEQFRTANIRLHGSTKSPTHISLVEPDVDDLYVAVIEILESENGSLPYGLKKINSEKIR